MPYLHGMAIQRDYSQLIEHLLQQYLRKEGIKCRPNASAGDQEVNGLAEALMKHLKKGWHTFIVGVKLTYQNV